MGTERDMNMTIIALGVFLPWESSHAVGPRTAYCPVPALQYTAVGGQSYPGTTLPELASKFN